ALDGYIHGSGLLAGDAGGAGQGCKALAADQNEVDATGKPGMVLCPLADEMARHGMGCEPRLALDAGPGENQALTARKVAHLKNECGRTVGIFLRALSKILEPDQVFRIGGKDEMRIRRR